MSLEKNILRFFWAGYAVFLMASIPHLAEYFFHFDGHQSDTLTATAYHVVAYMIAIVIDASDVLVSIAMVRAKARGASWATLAPFWLFILFITLFSWAINWQYNIVFADTTFAAADKIELGPFVVGSYTLIDKFRMGDINPVLGSSFQLLILVYSAMSHHFSTMSADELKKENDELQEKAKEIRRAAQLKKYVNGEIDSLEDEDKPALKIVPAQPTAAAPVSEKKKGWFSKTISKGFAVARQVKDEVQEGMESLNSSQVQTAPADEKVETTAQTFQQKVPTQEQEKFAPPSDNFSTGSGEKSSQELGQFFDQKVVTQEQTFSSTFQQKDEQFFSAPEEKNGSTFSPPSEKKPQHFFQETQIPTTPFFTVEPMPEPDEEMERARAESQRRIQDLFTVKRDDLGEYSNYPRQRREPQANPGTERFYETEDADCEPSENPLGTEQETDPEQPAYNAPESAESARQERRRIGMTMEEAISHEAFVKLEAHKSKRQKLIRTAWGAGLTVKRDNTVTEHALKSWLKTLQPVRS